MNAYASRRAASTPGRPGRRARRQGADLNGMYRGYRALHQAVSRGNQRVVRALVATGADRSLRDLDGFRRLAWPVRSAATNLRT